MNPIPRPALILISCFLLLLGLLVGPVTASAREAAGQVTAVSGEVTAAIDVAEVRPLGQGDPVFSGDTISTGPNSRVRIVFSDNSVMALRAGSRLVIDEFLHKQDPKTDRSTMSLIRGGFRAVTGGIGQANPDAYQVETPVASIGIRGTDFRVRYCQGDCFDLQNIGVDPPPDGLYTQTLLGTTQVGPILVPAGGSSFTDPLGLTQLLPQPPPILQLDPELGDDALPPADENDGAPLRPDAAAEPGESSVEIAGYGSGPQPSNGTNSVSDLLMLLLAQGGPEFENALLQALAQGAPLEQALDQARILAAQAADDGPVAQVASKALSDALLSELSARRKVGEPEFQVVLAQALAQGMSLADALAVVTGEIILIPAQPPAPHYLDCR